MSLVPNLFRRLKGKSPKTLLFRGTQELRLAVLSATGGWQRLARGIDAHWNETRVEKYIVEKTSKSGYCGTLIDASAIDGFRRAFREGLLDEEALLSKGAAIRARDFKVLNHGVPRQGGFPWNEDWRFRHVWPKRDFRSYDHHAPRDTPYDVKYPWELSRLSFLLPLMQKALLERSLGLSQGQVEEVFATLADFDAENPYALSVNWHPMEVSMRGLTLVFLLDMALLARVSPDKIALLLKMITKHGEFLWRTIEYTDNRGNHYAANITALLVMGAALAGHCASCHQWQFYAVEHIEDEILRQFLPDGVNFEKALAYHKFVTELFLLSKVVMNRQKLSLGAEAERRLHEACIFAATVRRPDGLAPVWGDTDDAGVFSFDGASPRNHAALLSLGAVVFGDPELKGVLKRHTVSPVLPWILGLEGVEVFIQLTQTEFFGGRHFQDGGFVIVRTNDAFLMMDVGETGQNGLGGHGHNDILSFELCLEGHPFIVDPGCPTYTGDPRVRSLFRSTAYHNMLVADGREVAEILGPFRLADTAKPHTVLYEEDNGIYYVSAGHTGYRPLASPLEHSREITFTPAANTFLCSDTIDVAAQHRIDRYFHFASGVVLQTAPKGMVATLYQHRFLLTFDGYSAAEAILGRVSEGYGHVTEAPILKLSTEVTAPVTLTFKIEKI